MNLKKASEEAIRAWLKAKGHEPAKVDSLVLDDRTGDIYALHGVEKGG